MDLWPLVLAAGSGKRLVSLTGEVPKQFWRPDGRTSLLDQTLARLAPIAPARQTVTVVSRAHQRHLDAHPNPALLGRVVIQPSDKGTAAGVLLGLVHIAEADPDSIVVVTPSDHGVADDTLFRNGLLDAARTIRSKVANIVLLGVRPDRPCPDYGWVTASPSARGGTFPIVESFVEKPSLEEATRLLRRGAAWSTMVLVASTSALLELYRSALPHIHGAFSGLRDAVLEERTTLLNAVYGAIPNSDFSRDVLAATRDLRLLVWPEAMGWTDLGTPERLQAWKQASAYRTAAINAA